MCDAVGKTQWRTCFSSISHSGLKLDVLKSAMQKYARRRELQKMLWCVSEIYLFKALARSDQERAAAKGIITNLLNRLIIILDEELVFADWGRFLKCREWLKLFEDGQRSDIALLMKVCKAITSGRLLRLASDVSAYWFRGVTRGRVPVPRTLAEKVDIVSEIARKGDFESGPDSEICMHNFARTLLNERSPECYYWAHRLFNCGETGARRYKRRDSIYMLWELLFKIAEPNPQLTTCLEIKLEEFFVKGRSERHMWLSNAVALVLNRDNIAWDDSQMDLNVEVSTDEIKGLFDNRQRLEIDSYAIDMHCSAGRKQGRSKKDFAKEGALVVDEDQEYLVPEWRGLYVSEKVKAKQPASDPEDLLQLITLKSVNTDEIELCAQGCKGGSKVVCFKLGGLVWKEGRPSMNLNRDYNCADACKAAFGLRPIGMDRVKCDWHLEKIDASRKEWEGNWHAVKVSKPVIYSRMREIGAGTMLQHRKDLLGDPERVGDLLRIALFRGVLRVTDFCLRNVLVDSDGGFVSIDEHDLGKRKTVFGTRERHLVSLINNSGQVESVVADVMSAKAEKLKVIKTQMRLHGFSDEEFASVAHNFEDLEDTIRAEGLEW